LTSLGANKVAINANSSGCLISSRRIMLRDAASWFDNVRLRRLAIAELSDGGADSKPVRRNQSRWSRNAGRELPAQALSAFERHITRAPPAGRVSRRELAGSGNDADAAAMEQGQQRPKSSLADQNILETFLR
jgi:hypothetical protein